MSHWFHRSVLKATTVIKFDGLQGPGINRSKLVSDLKKARDRLLELLPDATHDMDSMNTAYILYLSIMSGFLSSYKLPNNTSVRYITEYKWTHTMLGQGAQAQKDAAYDIANMSINVAIWHMKHASYVVSKPNVSMDDAKEIHSSLRRAAGIFQLVLKDLIPLMEKAKPGSDLDPRVLLVYLNQCTGEAQEVTVARAIELGHNKALISALANDTSNMFKHAALQLADLDKTIFEQWRLYLNIKKNIYLAYAYSYCGHNLLEQDKCGEAIMALRESEKYYKRALELCKPYSKVKGPARPVKPDGHQFFTKIGTTVKLTLEKCERENGFIYHQKIPDDPPELETKSTYGLASPEEFNIPPPAPLWELAFEQNTTPPSDRPGSSQDSDSKSSKRKSTDSGKKSSPESTEKEEELPKVKEAKSNESESPKSDHGCVVQ